MITVSQTIQLERLSFITPGIIHHWPVIFNNILIKSDNVLYLIIHDKKKKTLWLLHHDLEV